MSEPTLGERKPGEPTLGERKPGEPTLGEPKGAVGIVVGHGAIAAGLVDSVRRIAGGAADALQSVSNDGKNPEDLKADIDLLVDCDSPVVVFVDLGAGSCGAAALSSCRASSERAVVCGVNLPMLLDFVFNRSMPLDELVPRIVEKGREGIRPIAMSR